MNQKQRIQEWVRTDKIIKNIANSKLAYNSTARKEQAIFLQGVAARLWNVSQKETDKVLRGMMQEKTAECYQAARSLREAT